MNHLIKTVLFDVDGTLLDTAPDLAFALNELLKLHQRLPIPFPMIRPEASHGGRALIKLGFNMDEKHPEYAELLKQLLTIYRTHVARETRLFPGMEAVLLFLEQEKIPWGVVTNKPAWLTEPLLKQLNLSKRAACIISGDTIPLRKPDPAPLLHACQLLAVNPEHCIYVGDAERDIQASVAAGMRSLVALYGYIGAEDFPHNWGASGYINKPEEIIDYLS